MVFRRRCSVLEDDGLEVEEDTVDVGTSFLQTRGGGVFRAQGDVESGDDGEECGQSDGKPRPKGAPTEKCQEDGDPGAPVVRIVNHLNSGFAQRFNNP